MQTTYGSIINGNHTDTSKTMKGAKRYATLNEIDNVSKRNEYFVNREFIKRNNNWVKVNF
jgi:hypothetical protein